MQWTVDGWVAVYDDVDVGGDLRHAMNRRFQGMMTTKIIMMNIMMIMMQTKKKINENDGNRLNDV